MDIESIKLMLLQDGDREIATVRTVGLNGFPGLGNSTAWGPGLIMLTQSREDKGTDSLMLHMVATISEANMSVKELWGEKQCWCCGWLCESLRAGSYEYKS